MFAALGQSYLLGTNKTVATSGAASSSSTDSLDKQLQASSTEPGQSSNKGASIAKAELVRSKSYNKNKNKTLRMRLILNFIKYFLQQEKQKKLITAYAKLEHFSLIYFSVKWLIIVGFITS